MLDRIPRRLSLAFRGTDESRTTDGTGHDSEAAFVAYGEDCLLSGRVVLDGDRLSDMLNAHDEYALVGVTVDRFDGGEPMRVDEIVVARDELFLVHATPPRGDATRRLFTTPQCVAVKLGPYRVRGFFHGLPGMDAVPSFRRRGAMVPLTVARIEYTRGCETVEVTVEAVIVNRELMDWVTAIDPYRTDFPDGPTEEAGDEDAGTPAAGDPGSGLPGSIRA